MKKCWKQVLLFVMVAVAAIWIGRTDAKAATIVEKGSCGDKATYTLDSKGTLTISGSGEIEKRYFSDVYYFALSEHQIKSVIIEDGITNVCSFLSCSDLQHITIPKSVSRIEDYTFAGCKNLVDVDLPTSILSIGLSAFSECESLQAIEIPKGVISVAGDAFYGCKSLEKIEVVPGNSSYYSRSDCNAIIKKSNDELMLVGCKETVIPSGVKQIGEYAFSNSKGLTKIYIPKDIEYIASMAFCGCDGLEHIEVASNNLTYDSRESCNAIIETATSSLIVGCKNTIVPKTVTEIEYGAFKNCKNLKSISIPDNVISIENDAFENCENLEKIGLSKNITEIQSGTFFGCKSLKEVDIPQKVTTIGREAFSGCTSLEKITFPEKVSRIEGGAFAYCTNLVNVEMPNSITAIEEDAFAGCSKLEVITLPENLKSIGDWTFWGCSSLEKVSIPDGAVSIGDGAFFNTKMKKITIPDSVASIGDWALGYENDYNMDKVEKYVIYGTKGSAAETYAKENGFTFKESTEVTDSAKLTTKNTTTKLSKTSYTYDGKAKKPTVKVLNSKGKALKKSNYTVSYSNNVKVGKATVIIKFKGNYTGTIKKTFTIKPNTTSITGTSRTSNSVTLIWKKQSKQTSGYQVQYATDKKFTKNKQIVNVAGIKKTSKKITGLSKKTTYYCRVRTYKTVNGKKYYSGWSTVKAVKTK